MSESIFYWIPFVSGILFGFVLIYFYNEQKIAIIDFPKPLDNTIYKDKNGVEYQYITKEVDCDSHEKNLKPYPIQ